MQSSSLAAITGHRVTTSERMEYRHGHTPLRTQSCGESEAFPNSKAIHTSELLKRFADDTTELPHLHHRLVMTPRWTVSCKCRRTRVSVSSCMHDARTDTFQRAAGPKNTSAFCSYKIFVGVNACRFRSQ